MGAGGTSEICPEGLTVMSFYEDINDQYKQEMAYAFTFCIFLYENQK